MTYNTDRRPKFTPAQRAAFLLAHGSECYFCGMTIVPGQRWAIEHKIARELLPPGAGADGPGNLGPIHDHKGGCHAIKTRQDRKLIAKSNRLQRLNGPVEDRRQPRQQMRSKGFQQAHRPMPGSKASGMRKRMSGNIERR